MFQGDECLSLLDWLRTWPSAIFVKTTLRFCSRSETSVCTYSVPIQLFQLRLSPEQSGKVEYKRERLLGIANYKWMNLLAIPSSLSRSYSTFPLCSGDNLNWIAVCCTSSPYARHTSPPTAAPDFCITRNNFELVYNQGRNQNFFTRGQ
jgi:hypothetical protein